MGILEDSGIHITPYLGDERRERSRGDFPPPLKFWPRIVGRRLWQMMETADTTPTKCMLAFVAMMMSAMLLFPGESMERPAYHYMAAAVGEHADEKWAVIWGSVAVLLYWRTFSSKSRPFIGLLIYVYAAMVYSCLPMAILIQRPWPLPIGVAPYIGIAIAACWVALRTGINTRRDWRGD